VTSESGTDAIAQLASRLRSAKRITILTGAGVSAASGVPTFRGDDGLWNDKRAEELATPDGFAADPKLVWEWYDWRRQLIAKAEPNAAHLALARWTRERTGVTLITQNVDRLHERAGSTNVVRMHGSIWMLRCWAPCDEGAASWVDERVPLSPLPPHCPHCGGLARPGVVWFGEQLDSAVLEACDAACDCDVFLSIGTSSLVYPAAGLLYQSRRRGAYTVEINPDVTEASRFVHLAIAGKAEDVLREL
jgi:NAD-dependent deacetylase